MSSFDKKHAPVGSIYSLIQKDLNLRQHLVKINTGHNTAQSGSATVSDRAKLQKLSKTEGQ